MNNLTSIPSGNKLRYVYSKFVLDWLKEENVRSASDFIVLFDIDITLTIITMLQ